MPQWQRNIYAIWSAQFLAMVGLTLIVPFLPFYLRVLGVTRLEEIERWSGFLFAAPFLVQMLAAPLWGVLGDRHGRKIMVLRAMVGIGATNMLCAFVANVGQLVVLRAFQGGVSGFVAAGNALVTASIPPDRMGAALGMLQTSLTAGGIIGPLFGGALADLVGYRNVFLITGATCFAAAVVVFIGAQERLSPARARAAGPGVWANLAFFLATPALRTTGMLLCMTQVAIMSVEPIFSVYVTTLRVPPARAATVAGVLFSVTGFASMLGAPLWGRTADRSGERRVLTLTLGGAAVAYAAQFWAGTPWEVFVFRAALGFFTGGMLPPLYAIVARTAPPERLGGIMGLTSSSIMLGSVVGPLLVGGLAAAAGIRWVFLVAASVLAISATGVRGLVLSSGSEPGPPAAQGDPGESDRFPSR
jgi:DHA1 family multidrug resistance protein-like MFS transporter